MKQGANGEVSPILNLEAFTPRLMETAFCRTPLKRKSEAKIRRTTRKSLSFGRQALPLARLGIIDLDAAETQALRCTTEQPPVPRPANLLINSVPASYAVLLHALAT